MLHESTGPIDGSGFGVAQSAKWPALL